MAKTQVKTRQEYLALIPFLKPGTYSGLQILRRLQKIIKTEPRRLDMADWELYFAGTTCGWAPPIEDKILANSAPECGTVACAAGWINIITGHRRHNVIGNVSAHAIANLGLGKYRYRPFDYWPISFISPEAKALAERLDELFGSSDLEPDEVIDQLDHIIDQYRTVLRQAKVTIRG